MNKGFEVPLPPAGTSNEVALKISIPSFSSLLMPLLEETFLHYYNA